MRFKILPYNRFSKSAKLLSRALNVRRLNSEHTLARDDVLINWGNSHIDNYIPTQYDLNRPESVRVATNKLLTFQSLQGCNFLPEWTEDIEVARSWARDGYKVYCRTVLTGHEGHGIIIASDPNEVIPCRLYTKQAKHKYEFRIHVFNGQVIDHQIKLRRRSTFGQFSTEIRNHRNGYVFAREGSNPSTELLSSAVDAVSKLGLNFGAVDIGWRERDSKAILFEVNTAPGIEGTTLNRYAIAFHNYLRSI